MGKLGRSLVRTGVGLAALAYVAYKWQPLEYEWLPSRPAEPEPPVDPETDRLFSAGAKVAIVAAHPDDPEFYIGGTLKHLANRGANLSVVLSTDGDKGYYLLADADRNRRVRRHEALEAARLVNCDDVAFLGYPDGRMRADEDSIQRIMRELQRIEPDYVLTFDPERPERFRHRDHRLTGVATAEALRRIGFTGWALYFSTATPNYGVPITDEWEFKRTLLAAHPSQFQGKRLQFIENMVYSTAITQGRRFNADLAEAFRAVKF